MSEIYNKHNTGGTNDKELDIIDNLFLDTVEPELDNTAEELGESMLVIDLDGVNGEAAHQAMIITERLSNYYFDQKYIDKHPYIETKIASEMDNIRRLIKMLTINEKAQDALITNITANAGKGSLYQSLTSLQNSMLSIQNQLNNLTTSLEQIFSDMQSECEQTFEEKDKEEENGDMVVRGSRDFIKQLQARVYGVKTEIDGDIVDTETGEIISSANT